MKVAIIGAGNVGATIAYSLVARKSVNAISLIDINADRALGEALDISHGLSISGKIEMKAEGYEGIADADLIVMTAGRPRKPDETRLDLTKGNVQITESILEEIKKHYNGRSLILVVANPMDVLTYVTLKRMGIDKSRVFGSGTVLDSARFRYLLSKRFNIDPASIHAEIIGEHGDSCVPVWSMATLGQTLVLLYPSAEKALTAEEQEDIHQQIITSGKEVIKRKGATYYAVSLSVTRIIEAIARNSDRILSVSTLIEGNYGIGDVCLSLPCIVNASGVREIMPLKLSADETEKLRASARVLKELLKGIGCQS
jgi:L-lactate dehydrogenase